jgi:hypothetical protein
VSETFRAFEVWLLREHGDRADVRAALQEFKHALEEVERLKSRMTEARSALTLSFGWLNQKNRGLCICHLLICHLLGEGPKYFDPDDHVFPTEHEPECDGYLKAVGILERR